MIRIDDCETSLQIHGLYGENSVIEVNGVGAQGPKGPKGDQGDPGPQGPPGEMSQETYDTDGDGKVNAADTADAVDWTGVTNTPTTVSGYGIVNVYTKLEIDAILDGKMDANVASLTLTSVASEDYKVPPQGSSYNHSAMREGSLLGTMLGAFSDAFAFRDVLSVEYFDGTAWQIWTDQVNSVRNLFDGHPETRARFSADRSHWRVTLQAEKWNNGGLFCAYQEYTADGGPHPYNVKLETCADETFASGVLSILDQQVGGEYFFVSPVNGGKAQNFYRITVEATEPGSSAFVWFKLLTARLTYGHYQGLPFRWFHDRRVEFESITVQGTPVSLDGHPHPITDVTGLQTALDGKADDDHIHGIVDVTGLQTALDGKQPAGSYEPARSVVTQGEAENGTATTVRGWTAQRVWQAITKALEPVWTAVNGKSDAGHAHDWTEITGKPATFPPDSHNHDGRYYTKAEIDALFAAQPALLVSATEPAGMKDGDVWVEIEA